MTTLIAEGQNGPGGLVTAGRTSSREINSDRPNQESDGTQELSSTLAVSRLQESEKSGRGVSAKTEAEQGQLRPDRDRVASKEAPGVTPVNATPTPAPNAPREVVIYYGDDGFPVSLLDWRREAKDDYRTARYLWEPLENWLRYHGYELYAREASYEQSGIRPRTGYETRAPDLFHAIIPDGRPTVNWRMPHTSNKCFPAVRLRDGTHVMLLLVCKNGEGGTELEILRRFSRPDISRHPDNHVIPLLDELRYGDMTFAVLPLLEESLVEPWFFDVQEVLDAVAQTLKGLAFLHANYCSHLDVGFSDIMLNFGGLRGRYEWIMARYEPMPFRSRLSMPCRCTFIDFEVSTVFPYGSDPKSHRSSGVHFVKRGRISDANRYGKDLPPEWTDAADYCVYKSDVFQIGKIWTKHLQNMKHLVPELYDILDCMTLVDPSQRPTMAEASARAQAYVSTLDEAFLRTEVWEYRSYSFSDKSSVADFAKLPS